MQQHGTNGKSSANDIDIQQIYKEATTISIDNPVLQAAGLNLSHIVTGFRQSVRQDTHGSLLFPHWNKKNLSGLVIENPEGVRKIYHQQGLWGAKGYQKTPLYGQKAQVVITSTALDGLLYDASHSSLGKSLYISPNSNMLSNEQATLVQKAVTKENEINTNLQVVIATTNDREGNNLADHIRSLLPSEIHIAREQPDTHTTWRQLANDLLSNKRGWNME